MSSSVNFKYGRTLPSSGIDDNDFIGINKGIDSSNENDKKYGSIYKGDCILGTTEASKLMTTEAITVTGVTVGSLSNGVTIPAGTDIMSLLAQMLAKELGVTATKPSAKLTGDSNKTVEKGTVISDKTYTVTYTDGEYIGDTGYNYALEANCEPVSVTFNGVKGTTSQNGNEFTLVADDFTVIDKVTVSASVNYNAASNVPVSNFDNPITANRIAAGSASTGTITYIPSLKWFVGSSEYKFEDMTWTSDSIRELGTNNWVSTTSATVTFPKGAKQQVIAIPQSNRFTAKDSAGSDITGTFNLIVDVTVTCGGSHTESYKIYVAPANAGLAADSKATITLV